MSYKNVVLVTLCIMVSSMYGMQQSNSNSGDGEFDDELAWLCGLQERDRGGEQKGIQRSRVGASFAAIRPVSAVIESDSDDEGSTHISDMSDGDAGEDDNYKENGELTALFAQARLVEDGSSSDEFEAYASEGDDCQTGRANPLAAHLSDEDDDEKMVRGTNRVQVAAERGVHVRKWRQQKPAVAIENQSILSELCAGSLPDGDEAPVRHRGKKRTAFMKIQRAERAIEVHATYGTGECDKASVNQERITPECELARWSKWQRLTNTAFAEGADATGKIVCGLFGAQ